MRAPTTIAALAAANRAAPISSHALPEAAPSTAMAVSDRSLGGVLGVLGVGLLEPLGVGVGVGIGVGVGALVEGGEAGLQPLL